MGNLILNFLQEQGILIVLGLMLLEGILHQWVASRRYRRLWNGIQSLAVAQMAGESDFAEQAVVSTVSGEAGVASASSRKRRRTSRRQEVGRSAPEIAASRDKKSARRQGSHREGQLLQESSVEPVVHSQSQEDRQELDSQLRYLKQSLDRIAAGRDQKLEEETRERRKLTPEQEAVIADILREYLS